MTIKSPTMSRSHKGLKQVLDRALDKGTVADARLRVKIGKLELVRLRAITILSSFETAARHSLTLPAGINYNAKGWKKITGMDSCPQCSKKVLVQELKEGCPWCGFRLGGV